MVLAEVELPVKAPPLAHVVRDTTFVVATQPTAGPAAKQPMAYVLSQRIEDAENPVVHAFLIIIDRDLYLHRQAMKMTMIHKLDRSLIRIVLEFDYNDIRVRITDRQPSTIPAAMTPNPSIPNLLSTDIAVAIADFDVDVALGPLLGIAVGVILA